MWLFSALLNPIVKFLTGLPTTEWFLIIILSLEKLFETGGPKIWTEVGKKFTDMSPHCSYVCIAIAQILELNENSKDSLMPASIAGHKVKHNLYRISAADGI
jgi:hypothetical protein